MPVFFLSPQSITPPTVSVTGELLTHLRDSLRIEAGETLLVADGRERRYRVEIASVTKSSVTGRIIDVFVRPPKRAPALVLGQALLKGEKMDWVIQKATELGVHSIVPVQTRHSIVKLKADRVEAQITRWRRIALEAAQQSEQWHVPAIETPQSWSSSVSAAQAHHLILILAERRDGIRSLASVDLPASSQTSLLVAVGPEGGWTQEELETAEAAGAIPITLGPRILRAETAAVTAIGILQHRLGELG